MDCGSRKRSISVNALEPRQKRKVTRACDICKAKKAKCSGTQPCDSCSQKGLTCLYETRYSRGKPPTPPSSTQQQAELLPPMHMSTHHFSPEQPSEAPVAEIPSRVSPELDVSGQYSDSTSGVSFLHRAWQRLSDNQNRELVDGTLGHFDEHQLLVSAGDKTFESLDNVQIPPLPRARDLVAMYFEVCIATYRLLHRPTVEAWLQVVVANAEGSLPLCSNLTRPQTAIVLAVLAVAEFHEAKAKGSIQSSEDSEVSLRQPDQLFCESARILEAETGYPTLESAQARLIQVIYLLTSSRMNQAWYTFGHTLLIISALGLHRRQDRRRQGQQHDYVEVQCRKRTFWVAYILDKYLGVVFGRPRHYHDDDIDQDLPDAINDEDMTPKGPCDVGTDDCLVNSLIQHAKLAQIAERISREVYSIKRIPDHERIAASHRLGSQLRAWKASLPAILGAVNPSSLIPTFRRQAIALKLSYCHAVMLAHRPFLLKNINRQPHDIRGLALESINECISAAQTVLETVDRMARDGKLFHAFWWTHYVSFCALVVVYVWAIQQSNNRETGGGNHTVILNRAERCLNHLAQATATNSPSRRYSIILQELRAEAQRKNGRRQAAVSQAIAGSNEQEDPDNMQIQRPSLDSAGNQWEPVFGSPADSLASHIPNFLDDWQTTDWLDLDASAFGPFPVPDDGTITWMNNIGQDNRLS